MTSETPSWSRETAARWVRLPEADDHKYRRGVLGARIGSREYPGAAVLGVEAAWRTGIGMVRYVPPTPTGRDPAAPEPSTLVLSRRPETVLGDGPVDAWLVGSGLDPARQPAEDRDDIMALFSGDVPLVIDAGALALVGAHPRVLAPAILTPHLGEFRALWQRCVDVPAPAAEHLEEATARLAEHLGATILLKGSVTRVTAPSGESILVGPATPWLATAGTGDVLAGILGTLVASHARDVSADPETLVQLGATAALIHDLAARRTTHPCAALDVAEAVPFVIEELALRGPD